MAVSKELTDKALESYIDFKKRAKETNQMHVQNTNGLYSAWLAKSLGIDFPQQKSSYLKDTVIPMALTALAAASTSGLAFMALPSLVDKGAEIVVPDTPATDTVDLFKSGVQMSFPEEVDDRFIQQGAPQ